jgi:hypothetical protein
VKYAGVLAAASPWRSRVAPPSKPVETALATEATEPDTTEPPTKAPKRAGTYLPWAELLKRTFGVDVLLCPKCQGPMKLVAMVTDPMSVARYLSGIGELTCVPDRSPSRGPSYWKSTVLRRKALGDAA